MAESFDKQLYTQLGEMSSDIKHVVKGVNEVKDEIVLHKKEAIGRIKKVEDEVGRIKLKIATITGGVAVVFWALQTAFRYVWERLF